MGDRKAKHSIRDALRDVPSVEELARRSWAPNPVNVAGFGKESTHQGYLRFLLDSERWSGAGDLLALLLTASGIPERVELAKIVRGAAEIRTQTEVPLGKRRKVDLVTHVSFTSGETVTIPIELKVDSTPGATQLEAMSKGTLGKEKNKPRGHLLLLLGASSVQRVPEIGLQFAPVTAAAVIAAAKNDELIEAHEIPESLVDWLAALQLEVARSELCTEIVRRWRQATNPVAVDGWLQRFGFRTERILNYYCLNRVRTRLRQPHEWFLYSGVHNTVMNWKPEGTWFTPKGSEIFVFFEFNDSKLTLKLGSNSKPSKGKTVGNLPLSKIEGAAELAERLRDWVEKNPVDETTFEGDSQKSKKWRKDSTSASIWTWSMDLADEEVAAEQTDAILRHFDLEECFH